MKITDKDVFDLIKTLSRTEKGNYVKYAKSQPGKAGIKYMQLFRVLDGMNTLNTQLLEKKLARLKFPTQRYRIRNYLYHSIVNFLYRNNTSVSVTEQILYLLSKGHVLQSRKLHVASNAFANAAQKLAEHSGLYGLATEAVRVKHGNHIMLYHEEGSAYERRLQMQMHGYATSQFQLLTITRTSNVMLMEFRKIGAAQTKRQQKVYEALYAQYMRGDFVESELDIWTRYHYLDGKSILALCTNKPKDVAENLQKAYDLIWNNLSEFENKQPLIRIGYALIDCRIHQGEFKCAEAELDKLEVWVEESYQTIPRHTSTQFSKNINLLRFSLLVMDQNKQSDKVLLKNIDSFFAKAELTTMQEFNVKLNWVCHHIYTSNYKTALKHINEMLGDKRFNGFDISMNIEIELLNILVHSELGRLELAGKLIRSLKRKLKEANAKPFSKLTNLLIKHYSELSANAWRSEEKEWNATFRTNLNEVYKSHPENVFWLRFNFSRYFKSSTKS